MHRFATIAAAVLLCATWAQAQLSVYEGFNYTAGVTVDGKGSNTNGDFGWANGSSWTELNNPSERGGVLITSSNLPAVGSIARTGYALSATGTDAPQIWRDTASSFGAAGTTLCISFILRKDATGSFGQSSDYFAFYFGNLSIAVASPSGKFAVEENGVGANESTQSPSNSATMLVTKIDFAAGNDTVSLYNYNNLTTPIATRTFEVGSNLNTIGLLFGYTASWTFDELRLGNSIASVTPVPEPATLTLPLIGAALLLRRRRRGC